MSIAGYIYKFGIHMGFCLGPVDEIIEMRVGDKLAWTGSVTGNTDIYIDQPNLFGGPQKEGGIQGPFKFLFGEPDQVMPAELAAMIAPAPATGFRGKVTGFFNGQISAMNPYPKTWSPRIRRALKGWDGDVFRPDLAIIPLVGPDTAAETSFGDQLSGTFNFVAPNLYPSQALVVPFGGGHINSISVFIPGSGSGEAAIPEQAVPYSDVVFNSDGTALVSLLPQYYGQTLGFRYTLSEGGFTESTGADVTIVPNMMYVNLVVPGRTITAVGNVQHAGVNIPKLSTVLNPDGSATIGVLAVVLTTAPLSIFYSYSGGLDFSDNNFAFGSVTGTEIEVPMPSGGQFVRFHSVAWVISEDAGFGTDYTPGTQVAVSYTSDENRIRITEPAASGGNIRVNYIYLPLLVGAGNLTPDKNIKSMNPAHILFEIYTNRLWGRGFNRSLLDETTFEAAAQTLFNEGFGLCSKWTRTDSIDAVVQQVLDTIGAVVRTNLSTGKIEMKLIRNDYDVNTLPVYDTSNAVLKVSASNVNTSGVVINEVIVKYREVVYDEDRAVNVQNLASLQSSAGVFNTRTNDYPMIPTSDLARRVAQRDLRSNAQGLRRFTLVMNRIARKILPGDVFMFQDIERKVLPTPVRVATRKDASGPSGEITLEVVQDIFGLPARTFTVDQPNAWVPPSFTPCIGEHQVFELPYFMLNRSMTPADFAYVDNESAYLGVIAERAKTTNTGYDLAVRSSGPTEDDWPTPEQALYCGYEPPDLL